jgi:hypothetical protein
MGLGLILLIHCPVFASDLHDIRRDVEAYLKAVHVTGTLEDYYYFYGQANESELELEIEACKALQSEPQGSACRDYVQCRWNKRGSAPSFYLNALSRIVPTGTLGDITFRHGPEGVLPHVMVSAKVGSHTLLFFRPIRESDIKAFGALSLTKTDGKEIAISPAHDLLSIVQKDPCRSILTGSKKP